jgi:uncharacterized protein (DUF433 family)
METATNYRYIVKTAGVRGGNAQIKTRASVCTSCFPDITRAQVYECLAYYEDHRGEIDLLIARQMAESA